MTQPLKSGIAKGYNSEFKENQFVKTDEHNPKMQVQETERDKKMWSRGDEFSHETCCLAIPITLLDSFKIFLRNFKLFFSIFALTTFPLSLLLFSLSLASHPTTAHVYHLEALALFVPTRFEARHLWKESRADAVSLLRLKALYLLPCCTLSLLAAVTAVTSTALSCSANRPSIETAVTAARRSWKRPLATSICVYAIMLAYRHAQRLVVVLLLGIAAVPSLVAAVLGAVLEVYLVAVLSVGLVVSIAEDRVGWDAIRYGSGLMEGRRFSGWFLSGMFLLVSGVISWELEVYMKGQDLMEGGSRVVMKGLGENMGLVCLFGSEVLWSYIVTTVFYCECRRRHVGRDGESDDRV